MTNTRLIAARIIEQVGTGRSLSDCFESTLTNIKDPRDRAFVQAVCYGICRLYTRLDVILSQLLQKPMNSKDGDVHALLLVGLYQLIAMRVPDYAAVTETVNATTNLKKSWARGFVNAILRSYLRQRDELEAFINEDDEATYLHPDWWISLTRKSWPDQWEAVLDASNQHPPFALRVNQQQLSREQYLEKLTSQEMATQVIAETKNGFILNDPIQVEELPDFAAGAVSVQDGAAQLAAELLNVQEGQHVLDACAAPGGKLTHLLECVPTISVVAVEKDKARINSIAENLQRLKLNAEIKCADAAKLESWWDGKLFDRILLDAPCSASGVVRRHPDIKLLRQPGDIKTLAKEQLRLLNALWQTLAPGGKLLYATCSIFPEENVETIRQFLASHSDVKEEKINATWGMPCEFGRQILPGMHEMDGFYYALLCK